MNQNVVISSGIQFVKSRRRGVSGAAAIMFAIATASASAATLYSPTPVALFSAATNGYSAIAIGSNDAYNDSPTPTVVLSDGVIAGTESIPGFYQTTYYYDINTKSLTTPMFTDAGHTQTNSSPTLVAVSSGGLLVGSQQRTDPTGSGTPLGTDIFFSTGVGVTAVPLPTTVLGGNASYSYTDSGQTGYTMQALPSSTNPFNSRGVSVSSSGVIVGTVQRVFGDGTTSEFGARSSVGEDAFYYDPKTATTTSVGLTGGQYDLNTETEWTSYGIPEAGDPNVVEHDTNVTGIAGNAAVGYTSTFDSNANSTGKNAWMYTPSTQTVKIGLVGGSYTYTSSGVTYEASQTFLTNASGQIAGMSAYVTSASSANVFFNPSVAWLYTPSATPGTATGFGTSTAGKYVRLGLTGTPTGTALGFSNSSLPTGYTIMAFLGNNGHASGASSRYDASGNYQGQAAWYFNGTTTVDISPTDAIHQAVSGGTSASTNSITAMNNTGMAAGYATRLSGTGAGSIALGQDAYVYDSTTGQTYFIDPVGEATSGYELSYIGVLSDSGIAIGYFNTYSGISATVLSSSVFAWSEGTQMQVLATFNGSMAASKMEAYVGSFEIGSDGTLYAPNTFAGATSVVGYTLVAPVPEPASLGVACVGSLLLLARRRRGQGA